MGTITNPEQSGVQDPALSKGNTGCMGNKSVVLQRGRGRGKSGYCGRGEVLTHTLVRDVGYKWKIRFSHCAGEVYGRGFMEEIHNALLLLGKIRCANKD